MTQLLDQLREAGDRLLEHELPSLDEIRKTFGALVKYLDTIIGEEEVAKVASSLQGLIAPPTNEGDGNVGDPNGGQPANVVTGMPTAADIAQALVNMGALPGLATPPAPAPILEPASPPAVATGIPATTPAPAPAGTHTADSYEPSPLPEPKAAPVIETSDQAPAGDQALADALAARGATQAQIDAALGDPIGPAQPAEPDGLTGLFGAGEPPAPPATAPVEPTTSEA